MRRTDLFRKRLKFLKIRLLMLKLTLLADGVGCFFAITENLQIGSHIRADCANEIKIMSF